MPHDKGLVEEWEIGSVGWDAVQEDDKDCAEHVSEEMRSELSRAEGLSRLGDDWDGEGSPAYSSGTLKIVEEFITIHSTYVWGQLELELPVPTIAPGPDGSIDLHWKNQQWELLVNIPPSGSNEPAVFYGDNYGVEKIRGSFDPKEVSMVIAAWLMQ